MHLITILAVCLVFISISSANGAWLSKRTERNMKCLSQEDRELIRRARRDAREAREMRKGRRKGAIVSTSPQGMTSWSSSIKIWFV